MDTFWISRFWNRTHSMTSHPVPESAAALRGQAGSIGRRAFGSNTLIHRAHEGFGAGETSTARTRGFSHHPREIRSTGVVDGPLAGPREQRRRGPARYRNHTAMEGLVRVRVPRYSA